MCLLVWQLYCHNFRLLNLCSRVYKRSEHLSLSVQVAWDRVVEQFILLSNYTPLTFHMRAPLCFHSSSTNWLCLIRLGSVCRTSTCNWRNSSARQPSQKLLVLCHWAAVRFSWIVHMDTSSPYPLPSQCYPLNFRHTWSIRKPNAELGNYSQLRTQQLSYFHLTAKTCQEKSI